MESNQVKNPIPENIREMHKELKQMRKNGAAPIEIKELNRKFNRAFKKWLNTL